MFFLAFAEIQLVPDGTIFIHIALILLMIWVLNRTFFRPINRVIESREKNKGNRLGEAEEILQSVNEKRLRYEKTMLEARSEGYELIENERNQAVAERQQKVGAVKEEITRTMTQQKQELQLQTVETKASLAVEAEKMAEKISSNILKTA
ncbi:MAG: ATP synthase F0 subunit B [Acidobacteriota bacterium]|jgi:F-type H+-transporting ATPase subunit b|nr:ATP synthase F0 subunit B [Acidobacteriota bacterium]MDQ3372394.1 ATP synthase F0 subunit B [Acidobacteriota bacterium]